VGNEIYNHLGELFPLVLLKEMSGIPDGCVRLADCTRDQPLQDKIGAPGDRIGIRECGQKRLSPAAENLPGLAVCRSRRVVRRGGDKDRELPCPFLEALLRKWRVVSSDDIRRQSALAAALYNPSDIEYFYLLREFLPSVESLAQGLVPCGEKCVGSDDTVESFLVLSNQAKANEAPPILANEGDMRKVERSKKTGHPVHMALIGVIAPSRRLIRSAEAQEVRRKSAVSCSREDWDHLSVEIRPGGYPMHEENRQGTSGPLVNIMNTQAMYLDIMGGK